MLVTEGDVVALEPGQINPGMYHAIASFRCADGSAGQAREKTAHQPPRYRVGDRVSIRYDALTPGDAVIIGRVSPGGGTTVPGTGARTALIFGAVVFAVFMAIAVVFALSALH